MFTHLLYIACVGKRREQVATDRCSGKWDRTRKSIQCSSVLL